MISETVDIIGTAILFLAPFVLALIVIVLVVAYPWLLMIPLGIWYLVVKYGSDEVPSAKTVWPLNESCRPRAAYQAHLAPDPRKLRLP